MSNGKRNSNDPNPLLGTSELDPQTLLTTEELSKLSNENLITSPLDLGKVYPGKVPKSYSRILGEGKYHPELGQEVISQKLADKQTAAGQFVSFLNQAIVGEILGGTMEGASYLFDLDEVAGVVDETENDYGNWLADIGKGLKTWTEEVSPIYEPPGAKKFDPGRFSWWMKNGKSVFSTIALMLPAAGAVKGLSMLGKALKLGRSLGKTSKWMLTGLSQAGTSRHMENMMEAGGVWQESYEQNKNTLTGRYQDKIQQEINKLPLTQPYDPESDFNYTEEDKQRDIQKINIKWDDRVEGEAKELASRAASNTYRKNWALLIQDIPQYLLLNKLPGKVGKGASYARHGKVSKALGLDPNKLFANRARSVVMDMIGEGGEEMYQFLINEQSKMLADANVDPTTKNSLVDIFRENYDDGEMWTSFVFGALGAGLMQTAGRSVNQAIMSQGQKDALKQQIKDVKQWGEMYNEAAQEYNAALNEGDPIKQATALSNLTFVIGLKSKQHGDVESAKLFINELGKEENDEFFEHHNINPEYQGLLNENPEIKESINNDIDRISNLFDTFERRNNERKDLQGEDKNTFRYKLTVKQTRNKFFTEKLEEQLSDLGTEVATARNKLKNIDRLSEDGRKILDGEQYIKSYRRIAENLIKYLDQSKAEKKYDKFSSDRLIDLLDKTIKENKDKFGKYEYESRLKHAFYLKAVNDLAKDQVKEGKKDRTKEKFDEDNKIVSGFDDKTLNEYYKRNLQYKSAELTLEDLENEAAALENLEGVEEGTAKEKEDISDVEEGEDTIENEDIVEFADEEGNVRYGKVQDTDVTSPVKTEEAKKEIAELEKEKADIEGRRQEELDEVYTPAELKRAQRRRRETDEEYVRLSEKMNQTSSGVELNKLINERNEVDKRLKKEVREEFKSSKRIVTEETKKSIKEKYDAELAGLDQKESKIKEELKKKGDISETSPSYSIQPLNESGKPTDEDNIFVPVENLRLSKKDFITGKTEDEELDTGLDESDFEDTEDDLDTPYPISYLSMYDEELDVLNPELTEFASNPKVDWSKAKAHYYLDLKDDYTRKQLSRWKKGLGEKRLNLLKKFSDGKALNNNELDYLLEIGVLDTPGAFNDLVDKIVIRVKVEVDGKLFTKELNLRASDVDVRKKNEKANAREIRVSVLRSILKQEEPYSSGLKVTRGHPNTISKGLPKEKRKKNVATQLGKSYNDVKLAVAKSTVKRRGRGKEVPYYDRTKVYIDGENTDPSIKNIVSPGMVLAITSDTINGDPYALKLNKSTVSEQHARILYEAFRLLGRSEKYKDRSGDKWKRRKFTAEDRKRTEVGRYYGKFEEEYKLVDNLRVGELIDLLVVSGKELTDPNSPRYNKVKLRRTHKVELENKRLYLEEDENTGVMYLHFGRKSDGSTHTVNLFSREDLAEKEDLFVGWLHEHKNYAIHLEKHNLQQTLNGNFLKGREFRIGTGKNKVERKSKDTYAGFVVNNNFVTTDVEKTDHGLVFVRPMIDLNVAGPDRAKIYTKDSPKVDKEKTIRSKPKKKVPYSSQFNTSDKRTITQYTKVGLDINADIFSDKEAFKQVKQWSRRIEDLIASDSTPEKILNTIQKYSDNVYFVVGPSSASTSEGLLEWLKMRFDGTVDRTLLEEWRYGETLKKGEEGSPTEKIDPLDEKVKDDLEDELPTDEETSKPPEQEPEDKEVEEKGKDIPTDKEFLDDLDDNDEVYTRPFDDSRYEWEVQDIKKELEWVKKKVNIKDVDVVDKLIRLTKDGKKNFSLYAHDSILLWEGAETGTIYHEAFHRVSLGYLTEIERKRFYRSARQLYNMPKDKFTDKQVEEKLAEEFREHVLSQGEVKQPRGIKKIFNDIYNWIERLFTGRNRLTHSDVNKLFKQVYSGKFRYSKVLKENLNNIKPGEYRRMWRGESFDTIYSREAMHNVVKTLTKKLLSLNDITNISDVGINMSNDVWQNLINYLEEKVEVGERKLTNKNLDPDVRNRIERVTLTFKEILGEKDSSGHYPKFAIMVELIDDFMNYIGIRRKYTDSLIDEDERVGRPDSEYNRASYEVSAKDNAASSVKFLIATLYESSEVNKSTGLRKFVNFNEVWSRLMYDIHAIEDIDEMIKELRDISSLPENDLPYYNQLADKLEDANEIIRNQFLTTFRKHKHDFINIMFNRYRGEKGVGFKTISADYSQLKRDTALLWNEGLVSDSNIVDINEEDEREINENFFEKVENKYEILYDEVDDAYKKGKINEKFIDKSLHKLSDVLNMLHIGVDYKTLRAYLDTFTGETIEYDLYNLYVSFEDIIDSNILDDSLITNKKIYKLAGLYADVHPEKMTNSVIAPGGQSNKHYKYSQHTLSTEVTESINNSQDYVNDRASRIYNGNSRVFNSMKTSEDSNDKNIEEAKTKRENFGIKTLNSIVEDSNFGARDPGRNYFQITNTEDYLIKQAALANNVLPFPTMGDRKTYFFMSGVDLLEDNVVDINENNDITFSDDTIEMFYGYYQDERNRIKQAKKLRREYEQATDEHKEYLKRRLIKNYHYIGNYDTSKGNAYSFIHFKGFKENWIKAEVKDKIRKVLNDRIKDELKYAKNLGVISESATTGNFINNLLSPILIRDRTELESGKTDHYAIVEILTNNTINSMMGVIEAEKVFFGDPALFKADDNVGGNVADDMYKRWSAVGSPGDKFALKLEEEGSTYNVSTFNTQEFSSDYYDTIYEKHVELYERFFEDKYGKPRSDLAKKLAKERLKALTSVDSTDGQVFVSPEMYRSMSKRLGLWSDDRQKAFDLLQSEKQLSPQEEIESLNIALNPYKTSYIGHHNYDNIDLLIFDKMSMGTIFRRQVTGTHLEEVLDRMELKGKYSKDKEGNEHLEKIHAFKFDSAVKIGGMYGIDMFTNSEGRNEISDLSEAHVFKQDFNNLRYQVVTDVHDVNDQTLGTQVWKIASSNIQKDQPYGEFENGQDLLNALNKSRATISDLGRHEINARLAIKNGKISNRRLISMLYQDAKKAGKSSDFIEALNVSDETDEFYLEIDSFSDRRWIYSRLFGLIEKKTVDLNLPGNQLVQISDYGQSDVKYSKELGFNYSEKGDTTVYTMEARVSIRLFRQFIPDYEKLTFEEKRQYVKSNLEVLGYRIPTQGQNSAVRLKIVELLPENSGDIINLPLEFTALTGSDFDIDKVYVATYNYEHDRKSRTLKKIPFSTDDKTLNTRYNNKVWELYRIYRKHPNIFTEGDMDKINKHLKEKQDITKQKLEGIGIYRNEGRRLHSLYNKFSLAERKYAEASNTEEKTKWDNILRDIQAEIDSYEEFFVTEGEFKEIFKGLNNVAKEVLFNTIKSSLVKSNLIPATAEAFSELPIEEQNTAAANQNRILDIFFTVLSDEKHFLATSTPLGALTDKLKEKASLFSKLSGKEDFKYAPAFRMLAPSFQATVKDKFSSFKFGIPPFALANAHHSLTQQADIALETDLDLGFNKGDVIYFNRIRGEDDINITDWLSALIDANVDGANDPYIIDLNVGEAVYDVMNFMIRAGVGERTFDFISQPIIKSYSSYFKNAKPFKERSEKSNEDIAYNEALMDIVNSVVELGEFETDKDAFKWIRNSKDEYETPLRDLLKSDLINDIDKSTNKNFAYYKRQLSILNHFMDILGAAPGSAANATALKNLVLSTRIDTGGAYGRTPLDINMFILNFRELEKDGKWRNLDRLLSSDGVQKENGTMLSTLFKNSTLLLKQVLSDKSLYATDGFISIFNELLESSANGTKSSRSATNTIMEEMYSFFAGQFFFDEVNGMAMTAEKVKELLFDPKKSIFSKLIEIKQGKHKSSEKLQDNEFINSLVIDFMAKGPFYESNSDKLSLFLKMPYRTLADKLETDDFIDDFRELFSDSNEDIKDVAKMLYLYSFFTSGFRNRLYSYNALIPASTQREFDIEDPNNSGERKIISFNTHIKSLLKDLSTAGDALPRYFAEARREVFSNNWFNSSIVPTIQENKIPHEYADHDNNTVAYGIKVQKVLGVTEDDRLLYQPYLLLGRDEDAVLLEYGYYDKTNNEAVYRVIPKKGVQKRGIVLKEYGIKSVKSILEINNPKVIYTYDQVGKFIREDNDYKIYDIPAEEQIVSKSNPVEILMDQARTMREETEQSNNQPVPDIEDVEIIDEENTEVPVKTVMSGLQSGIDEDGLDIANELNYNTAGYTTENYQQEGRVSIKNKAKRLNVSAVTQDQIDKFKKQYPYITNENQIYYLVRTELNVQNSDATIYLSGNLKDSAGFKATRRYAAQEKKPFYIYVPENLKKDSYETYGTVFHNADQLRALLIRDKVEVLNIAGSRASKLSDTARARFKAMIKDVLSPISELKESKVETKQAQTKATVKRSSLSSPRKPLEVFVDGSDIKGTGQIGYGVHLKYNGKDYQISETIDKSGYKEKYNLSDEELVNAISNPTMELAAAVRVLKEFTNTNEHIKLIQDYNGVEKWLTNEWKRKKPWIRDLAEEGERYIKQIEANGGSVTFKWIPGHIDSATMTKHKNVFKNSKGVVDQNLVDKFRNGNDRADALARDREEYDSISKLIKKPSIKQVAVDKTMSWGDLKNLPVYSDTGVMVMRKQDTHEHFGNPFTGSNVKGLIQRPDVASAVQAYKDWLLGDNSENVNPKQRQWILSQIEQGKLDNKKLLYMKDKGEYYSHADALADIVNQTRKTTPVQGELFSKEEKEKGSENREKC